jgi:hypothetical protein
MENNFQRIGSISNTHVGGSSRGCASLFLRKQEFILQSNFVALVGHSIKKPHRFDLGSDDPPILVECKSFTLGIGRQLAGCRKSSTFVSTFRERLVHSPKLFAASIRYQDYFDAAIYQSIKCGERHGDIKTAFSRTSGMDMNMLRERRRRWAYQPNP